MQACKSLLDVSGLEIFVSILLTLQIWQLVNVTSCFTYHSDIALNNVKKLSVHINWINRRLDIILELEFYDLNFLSDV